MRGKIELMTRCQDGFVVPGMALCWADVSNAAVPMLDVVPLDKTGCPIPRGGQICKATGWEFRAVFRRAE